MKHILLFVSIVAIFLMSFSIEMRPDVKVKKGETFSVELEYVAGTGYTWQWNQDTTNFDSVSVEYKCNDNLIGGAGTMVWTFTAKEKGDYTMSFVYKRPWESASDKQKTVFVRVK